MLSRLRDHFLSRHGAWFWKHRHWLDRMWTDGYLNEESLNHPHRQYLLSAISKYEPFNSLLEYGCGPGANLLLLSEKYPKAMFYGIDYEHAISRAVQRGTIQYSLARPEGMVFDIFLTDACLIYLESLMGIADAIRMYSKHYIGVEWHSDKGPFVDFGHHVHNYRDYFHNAKITKLPHAVWPDNGWGKHGALIEVNIQ